MKGRLVVFGPTDEARKVLRSTGIDTIIPVVADEAAAIAECNK
jgi:anti-sigma B factor antagonist